MLLCGKTGFTSASLLCCKIKKGQSFCNCCMLSVCPILLLFYMPATVIHKREIHCLPIVRRSILWFAGTYGIFSTFAEDSSCSVYPPPVYFCQFILRGIPFWHWFIFIVFLFADFMPFFFIRMMV